MPRPRLVDRPTVLTLTLPTSVRTRLDEYLYSPLEHKIPTGSYVQFFTTRLNEFFLTRGFDLGEALGLEARKHLIRATPETIELLKTHLK